MPHSVHQCLGCGGYKTHMQPHSSLYLQCRYCKCLVALKTTPHRAQKHGRRCPDTPTGAILWCACTPKEQQEGEEQALRLAQRKWGRPVQ